MNHRCVAAALLLVGAAGSGWAGVCAKPVYLTFDTGHMGVADLVAQVHAAVLDGTTPVVVKVQRAGAAEQVLVDLQILERLGRRMARNAV